MTQNDMLLASRIQGLINRLGDINCCDCKLFDSKYGTCKQHLTCMEDLKKVCKLAEFHIPRAVQRDGASVICPRCQSTIQRRRFCDCGQRLDWDVK